MNGRNLLTIGILLAFLVPCGTRENGRGSAAAQGTTRTARDSKPTGPKADEESARALNEGLARGFNPSSKISTLPYFIVTFLVLGVLVAVLVYADRKYRQYQKEGYENPNLLFRELCGAHQLTKLERSLLRDIARELDLEDALPLFIDPKYFFQALEEPEFADSRRAIKYLLGKLFDLRPDTDPRLSDSAPHSGSETVSDSTLIYPKP